MTLEEFNCYMSAFEYRRNLETADCILTGFYAAYYTNGGKKAKAPQELIDKLFIKKQNFQDGLKDIERIKQLERKYKEENLNG